MLGKTWIARIAGEKNVFVGLGWVTASHTQKKILFESGFELKRKKKQFVGF